ncbi:MAG: hypothetical protein JRI68_07830 [Deltaproteobacteria bacterium]|nr:hypothetical protein [Deltaproteobacteria bacterium]
MKTSLLTLLIGCLALSIPGCGDDSRDKDDDDDACEELGDKMVQDCGADPGTINTQDCTADQLRCADCLVGCLDQTCSNMTDCATDCTNDCS